MGCRMRLQSFQHVVIPVERHSLPAYSTTRGPESKSPIFRGSTKMKKPPAKSRRRRLPRKKHAQGHGELGPIILGYKIGTLWLRHEGTTAFRQRRPLLTIQQRVVYFSRWHYRRQRGRARFQGGCLLPFSGRENASFSLL